MMTVPTPSLSVELLSVDPLDLVAACRRDATITEAGAARAKVP